MNILDCLMETQSNYLYQEATRDSSSQLLEIHRNLRQGSFGLDIGTMRIH